MSVTKRVFTGEPPASSTLPERGWALALLNHYLCIVPCLEVSDPGLTSRAILSHLVQISGADRVWRAGNRLIYGTGYIREGNRVDLDDCPVAFAWGQVHPGLTSWDILSRPCGTDRVPVIADLILSECCPNRPIEKS